MFCLDLMLFEPTTEIVEKRSIVLAKCEMKYKCARFKRYFGYVVRIFLVCQ